VQSDKLILDADADTTISADTDDQIDFKLGGVDEMTMSSSGIVINEGSNDRDFRIETNGYTHCLFIDGGNDNVFINKSSATANWFNGNSIVPSVEIFGTANTSNRMTALTYGSADAGAAILAMGKSRSATPDNYTIIQDDDQMGIISFQGTDGTHFLEGASIRADIDGTPGANDMPGRLEFHTTADGADAGTERMRIESDGDVVIGATSTSSKLSITQTGDLVGFANLSTNASYANHMNYWQAARAGSTSFNFLICISNNASSNDIELRIKGNGAVTSDSAYDSSGGDYAEYFEWKDGNTSSEDRVGYSIILDGEKIIKATDSDDASKIVGVVSGNPSVVGDADIDRWKKKYLKDDFNRFIMEEYTVTTWTEKTYTDDGSSSPEENINHHTDRIPSDVTVPTEDVKNSDGRVIKTKAVVVTTEDDGVTKLTRKKLNPDWDSTKTYVPREDRKEWDVVGLMGKLRLRKGQPTGTNWIKMRDISETVEEWLVR
jgi:hypothetical protein